MYSRRTTVENITNFTTPAPSSPIAIAIAFLMSKVYLSAYNAASAVAWAAILGSTFLDVLPGGFYDTHQYTDYPHKLLVRVQVINAVFEITHALTGLVPSPLSSLLLQFFARLIITVGISWYVPESAGNYSLPAYVALSVAWSVTEIIRYSFYFAKQQGSVPDTLQWLRYSAFIVLYPLGVVSEPWVVVLTLDYVHGFYYWFLALGMFLYIPGFVQLYGYMFKQRRRYLGPAKKTE
ncbi:hypothetical protein FT663_03013 [Candidozyma haemuli var. vulneris]|uniref:Very-long-chain (3R)-3-hydroxyacyl-CoA dehydratase n=1 Tax=Candidozyma haemuli TaxID=45357 RepID=A0A2V1B0E7_9ASCO|nr:hypothetical protein CXQ85_004094 [[Candida] haemuloni]KAF3989079.1 hypothetical protein FT662_03053 [[Candida] haemuloni var. vulneris]KAF3990849.1 hypothetical protein FT663_03013 [[Candida] haemuloni var. vulneris]PVH23800.1 hypothetical protein CXQ85_004094 [[Candida] haemuloni]